MYHGVLSLAPPASGPSDRIASSSSHLKTVSRDLFTAVLQALSVNYLVCSPSLDNPQITIQYALLPCLRGEALSMRTSEVHHILLIEP